MADDRDDSVKICFDRILPEELQRHEERFANSFEGVELEPGGELPARMAVLVGKVWENGKTITAAFVDGEPEVQQRVEPIAHEWSQHANLALDFGNHAEPDIRISYAQSGSWSYLGIDALSIPQDRPTMNYGWLRPETGEREYRRVVLHEFGHALAAIHEHQNPAGSIPWDKEKVYRAYMGPPNNWTREQIDHNLFRKYDQTVTQFSEFDAGSIMLYPIPAELLTDPSRAVGLNTELSDSDKSFIGTLYPEERKGNELVVDGDAVEASIGEHGEQDEFWFSVAGHGTYTVETHGQTDVVMNLLGPDDSSRRIAEDDDSGRNLNARITAELDPGRYTVRVGHYWPRGTGTYSVTVRSG